MKKWIALFLVALLIIGCAPTGSTSIITEDSETDDSWTETKDAYVYKSDRGISYTAHKLPFACEYNEKSFELKRIEYYKDKIGKSYILFAIMVLDISEIPSEELDWFIEDSHSEYFTTFYLSNDDNDYDFDKMTPIGVFHYTDKKELLYIYVTPLSKENRYEFDQCHISAEVSAKQKEKYEYTNTETGETKKLHKSNSITYYCDIDKTKIIALDKANDGLKSFIISQVNKLGDSYSKIH